MAIDFGASENIFFEICKISEFGIGFEASDVFFFLGQPEKINLDKWKLGTACVYDKVTTKFSQTCLWITIIPPKPLNFFCFKIS